MNKRILLIGEEKSFMVNALIKGLTEQGFQVMTVKPDVNQISKVEDKPDIYLLYLDSLEGFEDGIVYLRDQKVTEEFSLSVVAKDEDLEKIFKVIPEAQFDSVFKRPLNIKEVGERLNRIVASNEENAKKKRILVVDDDGTMLRTIKTWLSSKYQVFMANSGVSAITFLAKNSVDLILLDYEMPITSGPQVMQMIRSDAALSSIPIMFLTNKSDKESVMNVLALKPEKYLLKTMAPNELIASIDEFFEKEKVKNIGL